VHELDQINDRLLDGLVFCGKAYRLFGKIKASTGGIQKLRLRQEHTVKRLIEEVIPVARYVQMRYSHGRRINVKWIDGKQQYDAYLLSSGPQVENGIFPRRQFLEITTAVQHNDHLVRFHINDTGYAFSAKGTTRHKTTKEIVSTPYVYKNYEAEDDFVRIIVCRINDKSNIKYQKNTVLVIQCMFGGVVYESEWNYIVDQVKKHVGTYKFDEIFLFDSNINYFATLYPTLRTNT
jgi:hypothetical protein